MQGVQLLVFPLVVPPWGHGENWPQLWWLVSFVTPSPYNQDQSPMVTPHHFRGKGYGDIVEHLHLGPSVKSAQGCLIVCDGQPWP